MTEYNKPYSFQRIIDHFYHDIQAHWNTQLTGTVCIQNISRNNIRNMYRAVVSGANSPINVLYPSVLDNSLVKTIYSHNKEIITKYESLANNPKIADVVNTVGKYMLYFTLSMILCKRVTVDKDSDSVKRFIISWLTDVSAVHQRYRCHYMFIGIPAYMWQFINISDMDSIRNDTKLSGPLLHGRSYNNFISIVHQLKRDEHTPDTNNVYIQHRWVYMMISITVPDVAMAGLGFTARDILIPSPRVTARMYIMSDGHSTTGTYMPISTPFYTGIPYKFDHLNNISALQIVNASSTNPYDNILLSPDRCTNVIFAGDPTIANPRITYNDVALKPMEGYDPRTEEYWDRNAFHPAETNPIPGPSGPIIPPDIGPIGPLPPIDGYDNAHNIAMMEEEIQDYINYVSSNITKFSLDKRCLDIAQTRIKTLTTVIDTLRETALYLAQYIDIRTNARRSADDTCYVS